MMSGLSAHIPTLSNDTSTSVGSPVTFAMEQRRTDRADDRVGPLQVEERRRLARPDLDQDRVILNAIDDEAHPAAAS